MLLILISAFIFQAHAATSSIESSAVSLGSEVKSGVPCMTGERATISIPTQVLYELRAKKEKEGWYEVSAEMQVVDQLQILIQASKRPDVQCEGEYVSQLSFGAVYKLVWRVQENAAVKAIETLKIREEGSDRSGEFIGLVEAAIAKVRFDVRGFSLQMTGDAIDLYSLPLAKAFETYRQRALSDLGLRQIVRIKTEKIL